MGPLEAISGALGAWSDDNGEEAEMLKVLEELARTGFYPLLIDNKLARLLSKFHVCMYLSEAAVEYQVPGEIREGRAGLIPESQLMRVLIADYLVEMEVSEQCSTVQYSMQYTYCMDLYYAVFVL